MEATPKLHRSYTEATPELHRSYTEATPKLHRNYTVATPKLHRSYTEATQELHRSYTEATQELHRSYTEATPKLHRSYTLVRQTRQSLVPRIRRTTSIPLPACWDRRLLAWKPWEYRWQYVHGSLAPAGEAVKGPKMAQSLVTPLIKRR